MPHPIFGICWKCEVLSMAFLANHPIRCELRLSMGWSRVMHFVVQNGESNASPFSTPHIHGSARLLELVPDFIDDLIGNAD